VNDPDGQPVELVVVPGAAAETLGEIEVGLTVADLDRSRAFYSGFVGLEELPPVADERFGVTKYRFRHGATTISLRSFAEPLPADTGSGGIQYVVSDVDLVDELARARDLSIDQPLQGLQNFALRTIWLDDPDGITNYFAETGASRQARPSVVAE
jgi:catechol 2,3-dioxygenase-like lactoylglutathione lyase family enzyme